jgi:hypothetical protein
LAPRRRRRQLAVERGHAVDEPADVRLVIARQTDAVRALADLLLTRLSDDPNDPRVPEIARAMEAIKQALIFWSSYATMTSPLRLPGIAPPFSSN